MNRAMSGAEALIEPAGGVPMISKYPGGDDALSYPFDTRPARSAGSGCSKEDDVMPRRSKTLRSTYSSKGIPLTRSTMYPASELP